MVAKFNFLHRISDKVLDPLYETNIQEENINIFIKKTTFLKCIRCWKFEEEVNSVEQLCLRCKKTLEGNV